MVDYELSSKELNKQNKLPQVWHTPTPAPNRIWLFHIDTEYTKSLRIMVMNIVLEDVHIHCFVLIR